MSMKGNCEFILVSPTPKGFPKNYSQAIISLLFRELFVVNQRKTSIPA